MSNYAQTKLMIDYKSEEAAENAAMQDIWDVIYEDAAERDKYSLYGSIGGAVLGYAIAGPGGAKIGYNLGGGIAPHFADQDFEYSMLESDILSQGKFNPGRMTVFKDDVFHAQATEEMDLWTGTAGSIIQTLFDIDKLDPEYEGFSWNNLIANFVPGGDEVDNAQFDSEG